MKILVTTLTAVIFFVTGIFPAYGAYNFDRFAPESGLNPIFCDVTKNALFWQVSIIGISGNDGCIIGLSHYSQPYGLDGTPPWFVTYEVVSTSNCIIRFSNNTGSGISGASPVSIDLATLTPGVATTTTFSFTGGAASAGTYGLWIGRSAGTANCTVKVYSITDSAGDLMFDPASVSSGGGGGEVVFPDPFVVQGVNDDLQNFAILLQIFVIVLLTTLYIFRPFTYHDRK